MAGKPINQAVGKKALDVSVDSRLLVQERNLKGAVSGKGKKYGAGGGRKPLGDLSNAGKPINQAGGKKALHVSVDSRTEPEGCSFREGEEIRKALSDISNSVVEPPPLDFDVFEELGMLHDHSKCLSNFSPLSEAELLSDESENPHIELEEEEEYYGLQSETEPEIYIRRYRPLTPMSSPECRKLLDELEALYSDRPDARQ
ncbi:hypothetical protein HN51_007249 [Arachis hypogaea]